MQSEATLFCSGQQEAGLNGLQQCLQGWEAGRLKGTGRTHGEEDEAGERTGYVPCRG